MLPWFAPVFAQVATLDVVDRTEARYVVNVDRRYEAATRPGVTLKLKWPSYQVSLGYNVSLLLTPLETKPRDLLVLNNAVLDTSYSIQRTTLSLSSSVTWGEVNFLSVGLQNPALVASPNTGMGGTTTGGSTPAQPQPSNGVPNPVVGTPGIQQKDVPNEVVRYLTTTTTVRATQDFTRRFQLGAFVRYTRQGGMNDASLTYYPKTHGTSVGADGRHSLPLSKRDSVVTSSIGQHTKASSGDLATSLISSSVWTHTVDRRLSTTLGAGLSITRISQVNGLIAYSVYPNFQLGIAYQTRLARGVFSAQAATYSYPALDPLRATVDPQVGARGTLGWSRDRFSTSLLGNGAFSIASPQANAGAFDSYQASFVNTFRCSDWVSLDAGGRLLQQQYRGNNVVPFSYAAFVGLTLGYPITLSGHPKR
jgi:hypothetical protein